MLKNKPPEDEIYSSSSSSETGLNVKRIDPPQLVERATAALACGMSCFVLCVVGVADGLKRAAHLRCIWGRPVRAMMGASMYDVRARGLDQGCEKLSGKLRFDDFLREENAIFHLIFIQPGAHLLEQTLYSSSVPNFI